MIDKKGILFNSIIAVCQKKITILAKFKAEDTVCPRSLYSMSLPYHKHLDKYK